MKNSTSPRLALLLLALSTGVSSAAAVLGNTSFEDPLLAGGPPFVGNWLPFNGGGATSGTSAISPLTGTQSLQLAITATNDTFAGVFQDVPDLVGGMQVTFTGFHRTSSTPLDLGVEIRFEWRNSVSNIEVGRTPNSTPIPGSVYGGFSINGTVPAGADSARVVYAIQSFGPEPTNNGVVFVDDVFFAIPEPGSALLAGLGCVLLIARRNRSA